MKAIHKTDISHIAESYLCCICDKPNIFNVGMMIIKRRLICKSCLTEIKQLVYNTKEADG